MDEIKELEDLMQQYGFMWREMPARVTDKVDPDLIESVEIKDDNIFVKYRSGPYEGAIGTTKGEAPDAIDIPDSPDNTWIAVDVTKLKYIPRRKLHSHYPVVQKLIQADSFHPGPFVKPGDRIELTKMENDPDPIAPGTQGTVIDVNQLGDEAQIKVKWDNGRGLMLSYPHDKFKVIKPS